MTETALPRARKNSPAKSPAAAFLAGGSEIGRRMRALDWQRTPLGATQRWSASLRTSVRILLTARQPMFLFWGERFVTLYNDAAKGFVTAKHPQVLGQPASSAWHDLWEAIGQRLETVRSNDEAAYDEAATLGGGEGGEATRLAISYSPVPDDDRGVGGVLCVLNETESFHEAILGLSSELDLESLVQKVTDVGTRMTKARFGAFFYNVKTEQGEAYQLFTLSGAPRAAFEKFGMPRATPLFAPTLRGEGAIRLDDVTRDPRYGQMGPHHGMPKGHLPVRSYLAVPVASRSGEVLGGLLFGHPEPGMFTERAERVARAISSHAGVAIDNATLFATARKEIEERARMEAALTQLHELATRVASMPDARAALQAILETAVVLQGGQSGVIHTRTPGEPALTLETARKRAAGSKGSVHSAPITWRDGTPLGELSVHFGDARELSRREVQLAEVCARHAADAIEIHRSREATLESERLYRAIGESINYGVWVCDENGHNVYVSESFLKLTGLTQGSYGKEIWSRVLKPEDAERIRTQWKDCIATGCDWEAEVQVRTASGDYRAILSRGVAIRDSDGRITGWAGMNLDIDRLKRVENELRELDQRKNEFLATLAHELRNPLAPIRNGLEIMRLGRGNAGMVEQARTMMERQLHQMIRLVDDLLDVSRVSRGKIDLRKEKVSLATVLTSAVETAKPLVDQNSQTLSIDIPDEPITLDGDATRLAQVFANLLNNAAKYTDKGGRITIAVRPIEGAVEVSIRDNGIGIPPDMLESVFGIFTQVERSLEKARGGLGIGLSIARRLIEMHGGTVVARSEGPGTGSEFLVTLPTIDALPSSADTTSPGMRRTVRMRRILIADDNIDAASSLSLMLQVMGYDVRVAHDGLEALAVAESFRPDAMLLDIGMPGMNGYEVARKLRERPATANATIVALTGWGQEEDRRKSREFGFDHHLVKPVEPSTLETLLANLGKRPAS
jgi:PAS domain S-box-containing protein